MGRKTSIVELNSLVAKHWGHITTPEILYFSRGWFYFRFLCKEDMVSIQTESWNLNGFPLVFKSWSPTVAAELDVMTTVPIWVLFPNLDPCFWSQSALSKVASYVGRPICADETTTNKSKIAFARILVEVDISKELPKAMSLQTPYRGKILQKIVYEWVPYYCHTCKKVGHTKDKCSKNAPPKVYKLVQKEVPVAPPQPASEKEGFTSVQTASKPVKDAAVVPTPVRNSFSVLPSEGEETVVVHLDADEGIFHVELEPGGISPPPSPQ
ncbi:uncharacterized protein LOC141629543 [Silene latifolia]|uniref:uncharacterized protein LOC141629543 n=1 Tax=Silene latifolia TaxID=37657 RepID=UPI003D76B411